MDWKKTGKRILMVLLLVLLGAEICMELRYPCDELVFASKDTEKILRQAPEVSITEEDMYHLRTLPQVGWSGEYPDRERVPLK